MFLWKFYDPIVVLLEELDMHFHSYWASSNQLQGHFTSDVNYSTFQVEIVLISSINLLFFHLHFFLVNVSTGNNGLKDIAWSQSWFSICNLCLWGGISFSAVPMRFEKDLKWHGAKSVLRLIIDYSSILFSILVKSWYKNYGSAIKCV